MGHEEAAKTSSVDVHELKGEMIHELSPFYEGHDLSLFGKVEHYIQHLIEGHHQAKINTKDFTPVKLEELSARQQVSRTVFSLKKIKAFNHGFFTSSEEQILEPLPLGITTYGMKYAFAAFDAAFLTYFWRNWNFNIRTAALMTGFLGFQIVTLQIPNLANEVLIQTPRRRALAKRYISSYGAGFFNDIVNPNYDLKALSHLHNKLNPN